MLLAPEGFAHGHVERADVCVIGSGPAGLTLAHELAGRGVRVLLAEAGGWDWEADGQALFEGRWEGEAPYPLEAGRLRQFGGTSGHWDGFCRPLDPADFRPRAGIPMTGWPIGREALDPYVAPTAAILEVRPEFDSLDLGGGLERITFRQSPPVRFGETYRGAAETAPGLRLALNAPVVGMTPDGAGGIASAEFLTTGTPWRAEARVFLLCAGGIENARLLKWFNERSGRRLIANHDLIGRYWMEHPYSTVGEALFWADEETLLDPDGRGYFKLSAALQEELGVLSGAFGVFPDPYGRGTVRKLVGDLMCVAPGLGRRVMALRGRQLVCGARVMLQAEQAPRAENRVDLGESADALGIPELVLHWRRSEADRKMIAEATLALGGILAATDRGRLRAHDWITDESLPMPARGEIAGYHHMGGTRMSETPDTGIVNADCRVHDLDNLYIAGSSVFPTGGCSNPTMTIVQLALRLADHVETRLRKS